ncbi:MAG: glycosyltransferase family 39 protein [Ignavibacteria bacterium]|nr:glycosyltransferase family 39 protein [Ignavibacteria bacterium]
MNLHLSNRQLFLFGLFVLIIGVAIGSICLTYPFGRDQGIYAYAGKMLLEGKMNYSYVFDLKPPGIHFLFAASQFILGESMFNTRIFDILWQSLTAFILFIVSFRMTGNKVLSIIASFIYLMLYFRLDYWHTLQADGMLNLPFAISVLLLILSNERHSFLKIFFAGVLLGIALIFKYTIAAFLPMAILCMLFSVKDLMSLRVKNALIYSAGITVIVIAVGLIYFFTGSFKEMIDIQFVQTPLYTKIAYETESGDFIFKHIVRLFTGSVYSPLIALSVISFTILAFKKKLTFEKFLLFGWIVSSLLSLIIQWKFYYYHFLVIMAPIAIGSVYSVYIITDLVKVQNKKYAITAFIGLFVGYTAFASSPYYNNYSNLFALLSGMTTIKDVYISNGTTTDSVFTIKKTLNAVEKVNQFTNSDDKIYVWGFDPLVYYLSGRKCTSRFIYNFPLLWRGENTAFRNEFISVLKKDPPKLILVAQGDPLYFISGYNEDSKQLLERFSELKNFLSEKYVFRSRVEDFEYYELKAW